MAGRILVLLVILSSLCFVGGRAAAFNSVTVEGGGMTRDVSLGMARRDVIAAVGAPSRIKSEGHCLQYDTFDMSLFLDGNMTVERIYLGRDFRGSIGQKPGAEAGINDVFRDFGTPRTTERLTYTPSPSVQTAATAEVENKVPGTAANTEPLPLEYRGDRALYELHSHGMVMKYKYVSDTEGVAFWMDDRGTVYATVIYPATWTAAPEGYAKTAYLEPVYFDFDKYNVKKKYDAALQRDSDYIKKHADLLVTVEGHTDSIGTVAYNQKLSEKRAKSVYDFLAERGVPPSHVKTVGYGELKPAADNRTKEGRAQNRRVELKTDTVPQGPGFQN